MAYYRASVEVTFRKDAESEPVKLRVELPARAVYAETTEGAKFRAREIVAGLLAPDVVQGAGIEWDVQAWYDYV
jgi:hypothetical protein